MSPSEAREEPYRFAFATPSRNENLSRHRIDMEDVGCRVLAQIGWHRYNMADLSLLLQYICAIARLADPMGEHREDYSLAYKRHSCPRCLLQRDSSLRVI